MALTEPTEDNHSADATGAEFEENKSPHKVVVTARARVNKPEDTGSEAASEIDDRPEKTLPIAAKPKLSSLKPDKPEEDLGVSDSEPEEISESAAVDEMAKAAANKKLQKEPGAEAVVSKNVQSLIENKTYFVPIGQVSKRRNTKIFVAILLLFVAGCVGAYFMMMG